MLAAYVVLRDLQAGIVIFGYCEGLSRGIFRPTGGFGRADDSGAVNADFVQTLQTFCDTFPIFAVDIHLHHDAETVFLTQPNGIQGVFLRALVVTHPVVKADAVKGNLHQRITADLLQSVKSVLIDEKAVGVQFKHEHSALEYPLDDLKKVLMRHRLAAGEQNSVDTAPLRLVQKGVCLIERPLTLQGRIVLGVKAVQTVVVALACDHPVHMGHIAVVAHKRLLPLGKLRATLFDRGDHPTLDKAFCQLAFFYIVQTVAERK